MTWFARIKSENLKSYLRALKVLEEKQHRKLRKPLYLAVIYVFGVEIHKAYLEEE